MNKIVFLLLPFLPVWLSAQQIADTTYNPPIGHPAYEADQGPVIFIDEGHHNFHTKEGRYLAFSRLLERDGYRVLEYPGTFSPDRLEKARILVISNALHEKNVDDWFLPNPSAFTQEEIITVRNWVKDGGNLFLIADHMPMAGAAADLAKAFGFGFTNGFALDTMSRGPAFFNLKDNTLTESILTKGRDSTESVEQIASFTGQAFSIPADATPILTLSNKFINFLPDTAWVFDRNTPHWNAEGWFQGAFRNFGQGKIVVFGEAAMFTAQLAGPNQIRAGMNSEAAPENYQLLLNIIHWLDGKLD